MKALITGINGFAGGFLAEHLLAAGDQVLGVAHIERALPHWLAGVPVVAWDIGGPVADTALATIRQFSPDCVYHLAAISIQSDCGDSEPNELALRVNVEGTRRVTALCRALPGQPRLIYVSSGQVYAREKRAGQMVDEQSPLGPARAYGKTKLAAEAIVREAAASGLDAVIARAFQHAGPRQSPRMMLSEWARQFALEQGPVRVQRLHAQLDLSDVRDVVAAYRLLAEHGRRGAVYNVGSGRPVQSGEVLDELRRIADPARMIVEAHSEPKYDPLANTERLRAATGWQPRIDWRQTVADTWDYWKHPGHTSATVRSLA